MQGEMYIGDGVYVRFEQQGGLLLWTSNGLVTTNSICLEPEVWRALVEFVEQRSLSSSSPDGSGKNGS